MGRSRTFENETITLIAAVLLILLFGYTAVMKLLEQEKFVFQMRLSPAPMIRWAAPVLSWGVPVTELLIVAALWFEKWRIAGLYTSIVLLGVFEIYITAMLLSGSKLPCTCGGIISQMSWTQHLWFNAAFILIAACPMILNKYLKPK